MVERSLSSSDQFERRDQLVDVRKIAMWAPSYPCATIPSEQPCGNWTVCPCHGVIAEKANRRPPHESAGNVSPSSTEVENSDRFTASPTRVYLVVVMSLLYNLRLIRLP